MNGLRLSVVYQNRNPSRWNPVKAKIKTSNRVAGAKLARKIPINREIVGDKEVIIILTTTIRMIIIEKMRIVMLKIIAISHKINKNRRPMSHFKMVKHITVRSMVDIKVGIGDPNKGRKGINLGIWNKVSNKKILRRDRRRKQKHKSLSPDKT